MNTKKFDQTQKKNLKIKTMNNRSERKKWARESQSERGGCEGKNSSKE